MPCSLYEDNCAKIAISANSQQHHLCKEFSCSKTLFLLKNLRSFKLQGKKILYQIKSNRNNILVWLENFELKLESLSCALKMALQGVMQGSTINDSMIPQKG